MKIFEIMTLKLWAAPVSRVSIIRNYFILAFSILGPLSMSSKLTSHTQKFLLVKYTYSMHFSHKEYPHTMQLEGTTVHIQFLRYT